MGIRTSLKNQISLQGNCKVRKCVKVLMVCDKKHEYSLSYWIKLGAFTNVVHCQRHLIVHIWRELILTELEEVQYVHTRTYTFLRS